MADALMRPGRDYWAWLGGAVSSELGSTVMAFAIIWTATGLGGTTAGLVATSIVFCRAVLLLGGGSLGDRFGPRQVMLVCDTSMLFVTSLAAIWFGVRGPSAASLVVVGCLLGVASAFYLPAAGVFPRLFVSDDQLARIMATTSSGLQLARIAGPAIGGALLAWIGLSWLVALNSVSFLVIVVVVLLVVPPRAARAPDTPQVGLRQAWHGLREAGGHRTLVPLMLALAALVAGTAPATMLLFPLLCRGNGWSSSSAGLMEAAFMTAALAVGLTVAARGALERAQVPLIGGPLLACAGLALAAGAPTVWVACVAAGAVGLGLVVFNAHAVPRILSASPDGSQVRIQAVLNLAVTLPTLALSTLYGVVAQHASASWALVGAAAWAFAASVLMAVSRAWRTERSLTASTVLSTGPDA
ncbi:MAG TPA: MFS transporter [Jatrophihabitantaceae bacterium]|nr:MFS transporter [Jatrophihabitantaceae bacterium]